MGFRGAATPCILPLDLLKNFPRVEPLKDTHAKTSDALASDSFEACTDEENASVARLFAQIEKALPAEEEISEKQRQQALVSLETSGSFKDLDPDGQRLVKCSDKGVPGTLSEGREPWEYPPLRLWPT